MVTGNKYIGKTTLLRMLMSDGDQLSTFGSSGSTGFSNWVGKEIVDPEMLYTKVSRMIFLCNEPAVRVTLMLIG